MLNEISVGAVCVGCHGDCLRTSPNVDFSIVLVRLSHISCRDNKRKYLPYVPSVCTCSGLTLEPLTHQSTTCLGMLQVPGTVPGTY